MSAVIDLLIEELDSKFGYRAFYTLRDLKNIGYFGSLSAARKALSEGRLPFIKISSRRHAIPRCALLAYLRSNLIESSQ